MSPIVVASHSCHSQAPTAEPPLMRSVAGWQLYVSRALLKSEPDLTERAIELLRGQLEEIRRVVPGPAVAELQKVRLYFSPEYPGTGPRAEYHPHAGWLVDHGRDAAMARSVEFTNIRIFQLEGQRMPNFALHELAHAYHHRVLAGGYEHSGIKAAFEKARASGRYDRVERWLGNGRPNTFERSYALSSPMEFFAELSEAFFSRNDFFPFTRAELHRHDPESFALVAELWGADPVDQPPDR